MGSSLHCPECKKVPMKWIDPDMEDLLEEGIMKCENCGAEFTGIPGWMKAIGLELPEVKEIL